MTNSSFPCSHVQVQQTGLFSLFIDSTDNIHGSLSNYYFQSPFLLMNIYFYCFLHPCNLPKGSISCCSSPWLFCRSLLSLSVSAAAAAVAVAFGFGGWTGRGLSSTERLSAAIGWVWLRAASEQSELCLSTLLTLIPPSLLQLRGKRERVR